ncbi:hypothetical protein R6Q59_035934 [Mikania micrantha]
MLTDTKKFYALSETTSALRKLKILNLGSNRFNESIASSFRALTSLKSLDLHDNLLSGSFPSQEISHLISLEKLDLGENSLNVTPSIQGCKSLMRLERLKSVSLGGNHFNKGIISCLSFLPSLDTLDLRGSFRYETISFPMQELSSLRKLKTLDLSKCGLQTLKLNGTMSNLLHLNLDNNKFFSVDDVVRFMAAAFPSLRFLSLKGCEMEGRLFANEVPNFPYLKVLILSFNEFNGTLPIEALASFNRLKVLDLSHNNFFGSIPSIVKSSSSLKAVKLFWNKLNGSLTNNAICKLTNLHELDLSYNMFTGKLPECFNRLPSLKLFDISSNQLTGVIPPSLITNLTSLEYVDFRSNKFQGSFSMSWFSNHTKLVFVAFPGDNDKFKVETEEPIGWTSVFQFEVLILSNCNLNMHKGSVIPSFLIHQHKLWELDMSHNFLEGQFPDWLIKNNTKLNVLNLRDNSFSGILSTSEYRNPNTRFLDVSGNHMIGPIPSDIQDSLPFIYHLNLSTNSIDGVIPSSVGDLSELNVLDLSHNRLSGEVPIGLFTNLYDLSLLILSNNSLHGEVLSRNFNVSYLPYALYLDNNCFTGKMENMNAFDDLSILDISNNFFTGKLGNMSTSSSFNPLWFLDLSKNYFSGPIPFLNFKNAMHIHLGSNKFTGSIPNSFRNLTEVLTLDIGNNYLSGRIPNFLGELSDLRILILGKNNFSGSIPRKLCHLTNANLIDLSNNLLLGSIPPCLQNIGFKNFIDSSRSYGGDEFHFDYHYKSAIDKDTDFRSEGLYRILDEVLFTTKTLSLAYKGDVLDIMSGLDLSCNKLTGNIPEGLGFLVQIRVLNLSHNRLTGPIPDNFSNLANIESLDLSFNSLTGKVPSELIKLTWLEVFNVSFNNLSGRLPEMKAQFGSFTEESYKGNPLLCGPPLENECIQESHETQPSNEGGNDEKWYDMDMTSFYGSSSSTWFVFMLGLAAILYVNHHWRRWWFHLVEESMYTCYYFIYDSVRKVCMLLFR